MSIYEESVNFVGTGIEYWSDDDEPKHDGPPPDPPSPWLGIVALATGGNEYSGSGQGQVRYSWISDTGFGTQLILCLGGADCSMSCSQK